jgi:aryl-phospho-beta-D-glucosidase BglC (GH1 family)
MTPHNTLRKLKTCLTLAALGLLFSPKACAELPTAQHVASEMKIGWNLGNTLEAIGGETAWGNPATTQALIDAIKAAGFKTIRIPCAWDIHATNGVIDPAWMARVKQVVDYCINDGLYVVLNIHWDNGWLENNCTTAAQDSVNAKQQQYWAQIAECFKDYDEHLLFASANEPNVSDATGMSVLLSYHQTFIDTVRASGGNNASRTLVIQGPSTDIEKTNSLMNTLPTDTIANRLIVEVHYYTPYQFCLMTANADWGNMAYYWGEGYHSATDTAYNATWVKKILSTHCSG